MKRCPRGLRRSHYDGECHKKPREPESGEFKYIGDDYFGRGLYKKLNTKKVYVDVEGQLHTKTPSGEPDYQVPIWTPKSSNTWQGTGARKYFD